MGGVKDKVMSFLKTEDCSKPKCIKTVYGSGKKQNKLKLQKQFEEDNIIKNIRNLFKLKKESEAIRLCDFWNYNYFEHESNSDRKKKRV